MLRSLILTLFACALELPVLTKPPAPRAVSQLQSHHNGHDVPAYQDTKTMQTLCASITLLLARDTMLCTAVELGCIRQGATRPL